MSHPEPVLSFVQQVKEGLQPEFDQVMALIEAHYTFEPVAFTNGKLKNEAGENNGSCRIFAFARMHELTETETLRLFGRYYREDVLQNPDASDHGNIRNFMVTGWKGVHFGAEPLTPVIS